jgi:hypothetical protein
MNISACLTGALIVALLIGFAIFECTRSLNGTYLAIRGYPNWFIKGNIYEFKNGCMVEYASGDRGNNRFRTFEEYRKRNPDVAKCLVPTTRSSQKDLEMFSDEKEFIKDVSE